MSERIPCPICGESIMASAKKCRFCNEDIEKFARKQEALIERDIFKGKLPVIYDLGQVAVILLLSLIFIVPGLIALLVYWIKATTTHYRVTTQRILLTSGVFSPRADTIELFRVDDIGVTRPFLMRPFGYGCIHVWTSDRSSAAKVIVTKEYDRIVNDLRGHLFASREQRNVMTLSRA